MSDLLRIMQELDEDLKDPQYRADFDRVLAALRAKSAT
jgi:hypothetical protein